MAKAPTSVRAPVTERGVALLALIAASETGFLMLTAEEGSEIVEAGNAVVDTSIVEGDTAAVRLTEAGKLAAGQVAAPTPVVTGYEIETGVAMPTKRVRKSSAPVYPFDALEVGQSFHVAASAASPEPAKKLASSVTAANLKYSEEIAETETVKVRTYQKNADGSFVKTAEGKRVVASEETKTRNKRKALRTFQVKAVDASDPKGAGARVWRTA